MGTVPEGALSRLRESRLFRGLDRDQLERICSKGAVTRLAAGERIVEEGQPNVDLFVVLDGEIEVFLPETRGRFSRVKLAHLGPGECIGEYSFVDRKPASASVEATRTTEVFCIAQKDFEELLEGDQAIGTVVYRNLLRLLITRLREDNELLDLFRPKPTA